MIKPENIIRHRTHFVYFPNNKPVEYLNESYESSQPNVKIINYSHEDVATQILSFFNPANDNVTLFDKSETNIPNSYTTTTQEIDPTSIFYNTSNVFKINV